MEQDRYSANHKLYIVGIISLILSIGLFFFSMFILPFLIWNLHYDVPDFISHMIIYFQNKMNYSLPASKFLSWLIFFVPCLIAGYISYYISNYIDDQILGIKTEEEIEEEKQSAILVHKEIRASIGLAAKIFLLMILIVCIILLLHQLVQNI
ncbi:hypothetical protein [Legionella shakespearei]|uniref:Transmembrane protein n=1 Tax=Legionella shakespearei DSM 23087 TaxID=1122169 RepID=A0A0W0Z0P7_9GAMM|nr:hypothetical protein [Legionella shakespearei]KTD62720.1 transmembrane protein [Legionella shakespearei DSM 23087]